MARVLLEAICNGNENLAYCIVKEGSYGCLDSQTSRREGTALFFACSRGFLRLAVLLIDRGACVNAPNKCLATPLHAAVDNNHLEIVKLLLSRGADVNARTYRGDTSLHMAVYRGFADITQCLVQNGADLGVNECNKTPICEARSSGHTVIAQYLKAVQKARCPKLDPSTFPLSSLVQLESPVPSASSSHMVHIDFNNHQQRVAEHPMKNKVVSPLPLPLQLPLPPSPASSTCSPSSLYPRDHWNVHVQNEEPRHTYGRPRNPEESACLDEYHLSPRILPHVKPSLIGSSGSSSYHTAPNRPCPPGTCTHAPHPKNSLNPRPARAECRRLSAASCASYSSETSLGLGSDVSLPSDVVSLCADDRKLDVFDFHEYPVVNRTSLDYRRRPINRRPMSPLSSGSSSHSPLDFCSSGQSDFADGSSTSFESFRNGLRGHGSTPMSLESEPCLFSDIVSMGEVANPPGIRVEQVDNDSEQCEVNYRPEILAMTFRGPKNALLSAADCRAPSNDLSSVGSLSPSPSLSSISMTFCNIPVEQNPV